MIRGHGIFTSFLTNRSHLLSLLTLFLATTAAVQQGQLLSSLWGVQANRVEAFAGNNMILRLRGVVGYSKRLNNILFVRGPKEVKSQHVVFFPGDVQV